MVLLGIAAAGPAARVPLALLVVAVAEYHNGNSNVCAVLWQSLCRVCR
jgi:hypothetical protein